MGVACYSFQNLIPVVDRSSYVHPTASLIGDVIVGPGCYIGPGASLRGDFGRIVIEGDTSVQDNCCIHGSAERDVIVGRGATIGHGCVIHGCRIGENALVGMNAVVLDAAEIGDECLVAALALVRGRMKVPARSLVAGNPAEIVKSLPSDSIMWRNDGDGEYQRLARRALTDLEEVQPLQSAEPDRPRPQSDAKHVRLARDTEEATL